MWVDERQRLCWRKCILIKTLLWRKVHIYICLPGGSFAAIIAAPAYTYVECFALPAVCATLNYVYESIVFFCCNCSRAAQCWWGIISVPEELLKKASSGFGRWGKSYVTFLWEQKTRGWKVGEKPSEILLFTCLHSMESTPWQPVFKEGWKEAGDLLVSPDFSFLCDMFHFQVAGTAWTYPCQSMAGDNRMMLGCFEAMVKIPFSSSDCKVTVYLVALQCLIIGAGPCGLRTAIDLSFLGAKVVVIEKRDAFSRNNVLHLWPFTIHDLRGLGAKKFYGKFCAGSIDHISKYSRC